MANTASTSKPQKSPEFSEPEMEAARQLIQLSSGDSDEQSVNDDSSSVLQGKAEKNRVDTSEVCSNNEIGSSNIFEEEDQYDYSLNRRNKRYRYVEELYNITVPVILSKNKAKRIKPS